MDGKDFARKDLARGSRLVPKNAENQSLCFGEEAVQPMKYSVRVLAGNY
jgi:hypothetical protein